MASTRGPGSKCACTKLSLFGLSLFLFLSQSLVCMDIAIIISLVHCFLLIDVHIPGTRGRPQVKEWTGGQRSPWKLKVLPSITPSDRRSLSSSLVSSGLCTADQRFLQLLAFLPQSSRDQHSDRDHLLSDGQHPE